MQIYRLLPLALLLLPPALQAQTSIDLQEMMTQEELRGTGINSLSPAQLDALNQWLEVHVVPVEKSVAASDGASPGVDSVSESGLPAQSGNTTDQAAAAPKPARAYGEREEFVDVVSVIPGPFTGWTGKTVFELENGQVYQQRRQGIWRTSINDPQVRITRNFLGMFEMEIEGHSIGVKRLR